MDEDALRRLLRDQDDTVSWRQLRDDAGARNDDLERLLQVFGTPCRTAERIDRILRRGWTGRARACGPACALARPGRGATGA